MQTVQRLSENSDNPALMNIMRNRPMANEALFKKFADQINPVIPRPDMLAGQLQEAAKRSIQTARATGNTAAKPFYAASSNNPSVKISAHDWNEAISDPAIAWALQRVKSDPLINLKNTTEGSVQWLDAAKKYLDSKSSALTQSGDRYAASNASGAASHITSSIDPSVPDYAKARSIISENMRTNVLPMEHGQIGKLTGSDDFLTQSKTLLPQGRQADITPDVIKNTFEKVSAENPDILRQFLAHDLRDKFNFITQDKQQGAPVMGGTNFATNIAGDTMQEANLRQALSSLGQPLQSLDDLLSIYRAQGMKPSAGSSTAPNLSETAKLAGPGLVGALGSPLRTLSNAVEGFRGRSAADTLAKYLATGEKSVPNLQDLARASGSFDPLKQQILINLLMSNPSINQAPQQ